MIYLILDTNVWFYLANSFNSVRKDYEDGLHFKLLATLNDLVDKREIVLLTNDIIIKEWQDNKKRAYILIEKYRKGTSDNSGPITNIKKFLPTEDSKQLSVLFEKYKANVEEIIENNEKHIESVENLLLKKCTRIEVSKDAKIEASDLAVNKLAPFIEGGKNSMADALILLSSIEYLLDRRNKYMYDFPLELFDYSIFITLNKLDFSDPSNSKIIHPDLEHILGRVKMQYEPNLGEALNRVKSDLFDKKELEQLEKEANEAYWDEVVYCEMCDPNEGDSLTLNIIEFENPIPIENELYESPNQIKLFNPDSFSSNEDKDPATDIHSAQIGYCSYCNAEYIKCQNCDTATHIPDHPDNVDIECEGCGINYKISHSYLGSGMTERDIRIVGG